MIETSSDLHTLQITGYGLGNILEAMNSIYKLLFDISVFSPPLANTSFDQSKGGA